MNLPKRTETPIPTLTELPMPPDHISDNAKQHWYEIMTTAHKVPGYLTHMELGLVESACVWYGMFREATERLKDTEGLVSMGREIEKPNAWFLILKDSHTKYMETMKALGLTPTARGKIQLIKGDEKQEEFDLD